MPLDSLLGRCDGVSRMRKKEEKGEHTMTRSRNGTREEWVAARAELLEREKEHSRAGDELARQRRELPWVQLEKEYTFNTEHGRASLSELFDGRSQLMVYHFMFGPDYEAGCPNCSATVDGFNGVLASGYGDSGHSTSTWRP